MNIKLTFLKQNSIITLTLKIEREMKTQTLSQRNQDLINHEISSQEKEFHKQRHSHPMQKYIQARQRAKEA